MHLGRLERYFMCAAAVAVLVAVVASVFVFVCALENDALYVHIVHAFLWFCRLAFCCCCSCCCLAVLFLAIKCMRRWRGRR